MLRCIKGYRSDLDFMGTLNLGLFGWNVLMRKGKAAVVAYRTSCDEDVKMW